MSEYFQFGKKDEKLFNDLVKTHLNSKNDNFDINKRNNLLNRIKLSLRKNKND